MSTRAVGEPAVQALVWNFDGLIMDCEEADCRAWREEFAAAGVPITLAEYARYWEQWSWHRRPGTRMIDQLRTRAPGPLDEAAVSARRLGRYQQLCAELPARPGIESWLRCAASLSMPCAVATND
jgi:beta-phosphoglucomutase-like phosphatase (HAD superfamily)